jgi:DNA polymerase-4
METDRKILHIDLDAFFCAVEELRDPKLKGKPFAVGGSPDQRGVVASCSYAARKFGIHSAMPMTQAVKLCPDLLIVRGHYQDYGKTSQQVMDLLKGITPLVEQISIDEAFLDISELSKLSETIAQEIQSRINKELGLPCSIGIASNKLVAKTATDYGKLHSGKSNKAPNAIKIVVPGKEEEFLAPLPVNALWGVGPKTTEKLIDMNINTIGDLTKIPDDKLIRLFGKWGYALALRSRGIDDRPISVKHTAKSVSHETTFAKDINEKDVLLRTIKKLSENVSRRLVKKHQQAITIKIKLRWGNFTTITRQMTVNQPTNNSDTIFKSAEELFLKAWKSKQPVRLVGVGVSGLTPEQLNLWEHQKNFSQIKTLKQLNTTIKDLREKFGDRALLWGNDLNKTN